MNSKLLPLVTLVGLIAVGGATYKLTTPQPATRSMRELRDAGITDGQPIAVLTPERLEPQTVRRINKLQPTALRPKQRYARVLRAARCFGDKYLDGGTSNCVRIDGGTFAPFIEEVQEWRYTTTEPTEDGGSRVWLRTDDATVRRDDGGVIATLDLRNDGGVFERVVNDPRQPEVVIPSLRRDLVGVNLDASVGDDDGGESDDVDNATQYRIDDMVLFHCSQVDDLVDAGVLLNPYANRFCGGLNRLAAQPLPCMIPDGRLPDGGFLDDAPAGQIDCRFTGPYGTADGGPRWNGINVRPRDYAVGTQCLPCECSVVAGDLPTEWL